MNIDMDSPKQEHIPWLRRIWQEAFGDEDSFLDLFFSVGFSPDRCLCAWRGDIPVAAIYWFDATVRGAKVAYLYALATQETYRGFGYARQLMDATHDRLRLKGYQAALLVPGSKSLGKWYQRMGYEYCCGNVSFCCDTPGEPVALRPVTAYEYDQLRKQYLPEGSVEQDVTALEFLAAQSQLYAGENFLMSCGRNAFQFPIVEEFLGDLSAVPGILGALKEPGAVFLAPMAVTENAKSCFSPKWEERNLLLPMFRPLTDPAMTPPAYFAFPFN